MSASAPDTAQRASAEVHLAAPWEVFGQRLRRYEIYFDGDHIETTRGPIALEGVGLRVFRPVDGKIGVGFQATTDLRGEGLRTAASTAEESAKTAVFSASHVELPSHAPRIAQGTEVCSVELWERPDESVQEFVHELLEAFASSSDVRPSFGSLKATLSETSIVNSEGLSTGYVATEAELEFAVKASGGAEGRPPGEYWVTREMRQLDRGQIPTWATTWAERARDVRRARSPPSGSVPVGLPPALLNEVLPFAFAVRFSGSGRLRKMHFEAGQGVASETVTVRQDPTVPWSFGSSPLDDEGAASSPVSLIESGKSAELLYDALYGAAFDRRTNGAAFRTTPFGRTDWHRFTHKPIPAVGTITLSPGDARSDAELIEGVEDGVWIDQLGWPNPDPYAGSFGGEIRIGYRIHRGKLAEPIRGGTLGGLVFAPVETPSLLGRIRAAGARAQLVGRTLAPSVVVDGLTVASG